MFDGMNWAPYSGYNYDYTNSKYGQSTSFNTTNAGNRLVVRTAAL